MQILLIIFFVLLYFGKNLHASLKISTENLERLFDLLFKNLCGVMCRVNQRITGDRKRYGVITNMRPPQLICASCAPGIEQQWRSALRWRRAFMIVLRAKTV
uniref:Secreted protein n=1 Tax=Cyprinus carpio carpio TaxID=630221 RepID=A0A9J7ZPW5_CYPCA